MIRTARFPFSSDTYRTVTRDFTFGFPSMCVSGVIVNVRAVDSFPNTVRVTVTLVSLNAVTIPAKN